MNKLDRENLFFRIEEKLSEIEEALSSFQYEKSDNYAFFSGTGGLALYYYLKYTETNNPNFLSKAINVFDLGIRKLLEQDNIYTSFMEGISGYLWFYYRYSFHRYYTIDVTVISAIKRILVSQFKHNLIINDWDYMYGNIGICLNDIDNRPLFKKGLSKQLVQYLFETKHSNQECYWFSKLYPQWINFSLAHGITSILVFLRYCYLSNVQKEKAKEMLTLTATYILANANSKEKQYCVFPSYIMEGGEIVQSRLAWCYGDLSIANTLWETADLINDVNMRSKVFDIALKTCDRKSFRSTLIDSPTFCHGSIGLAYLYYKLFNRSNHNTFEDSMLYWLNITLQFSKFDDGIAGFKDFDRHTKEWKNNVSILEGVIGVYFSLATITNKIESSWDRCLLLS